MPTPIVGVRMPRELVGLLDARAPLNHDGRPDRSAAVRETLEEHFRLLADARRECRRVLTATDLFTVAAVLQGTFIDYTTARHLDHELEDADGEFFANAEEQEALLARLRSLGLAERLALADAVRRFHAGPPPKDAARLLEDAS